MKPIFRLGLILLLAALTAGCNLPQTSNLVLLGGGGPQAWIDAPLDGMRLPLGVPYDVVFHITFDSAVAAGELSVNGQVLATLPNPAVGSNLATLHQSWTPPAPGEYTLRVRAESASGQWGDYAQVVVEVGQPTVTPSETPSPTASLTPTGVVGWSFSNATTPQQVYHGACTPNQVLFAVKVTPFPNVLALTVFTRLENGAGTSSTPWNQGTALSPHGNGLFEHSLSTGLLPAAGQFDSAVLLYQFVATGAGGAILARSPVYGDVLLGPCGSTFDLQYFPFLITQTAAPPIVK
jgi:hypothetical protein